MWTCAHTGSTQTHTERFSSAKMSQACDHTHHTFTLLSVRIKVRFGYRGGTYCYSSLCSPVHPHHQPTTSPPRYPINHAHPAGVPAPTAWQCHLPARETTGGMWSLGAEITKRLKIDPGNRDVVFPNPLTSNPSDIFLYCLD